MSCPHGEPIGFCDTCDEIDNAYKSGYEHGVANNSYAAKRLEAMEIAVKEWVTAYEFTDIKQRADNLLRDAK